jgi:hypothetical protein
VGAAWSSERRAVDIWHSHAFVKTPLEYVLLRACTDKLWHSANNTDVWHENSFQSAALQCVGHLNALVAPRMHAQPTPGLACRASARLWARSWPGQQT